MLPSTPEVTEEPGAMSGPVAEPTPGLPRFEASATCPTGVTRCGFVVVPERHARPDGPTIRLAVDIYERDNREAPPYDAAIYLNGGPGGKRNGTASVSMIQVQLARRNRDAILYDQRGVGQTQPALECPEIDEQLLQDAAHGVTGPTAAANELRAFVGCRDRLTSAGIDLAAYTTAESAADLEDIRTALGYQRLNLIGLSYGTYLAQATMRAFPQSIRSVVLDSVAPLDPQRSLAFPDLGADQALEQVFVVCAADPACDRAYPRLRDTFLRLVTRLDQQPATVPFSPAPGGSIRLTSRMLGHAVFRQLYFGAGGVPRLIATVDRGEYVELGERLDEMLRPNRRRTLGAWMSVNCFRLASTLMSSPRIANAGLLSRFQGPHVLVDEVCPSWPTDPPDPAFLTPVQSELPTLIISGQFDPVTPPANGQRVAGRLPNSVHVEFAGQGHGPGVWSVCGRSIIAAFLDRPNDPPDASCAHSSQVRFANQ
jgi:pimeloyl-ACP methyl ester carboxylesterase